MADFQVQESELGHHELCTTLTWAAMAAEADANGQDVPDSIRRLATEDSRSGIEQCHKDCPHLQRAIKRGLELAERFGW